MRAEKYVDYMYGLIDRVMREVGPRESCSDSERRLARIMADEWEQVCDNVELETFSCSPTAFLGFLPIIVVLYILSAAFYWIYAPVAAVLMFVALVIFVFQFIRYKEMLDWLFPKRQSQNVIGVIKPRGEVKKRVVVSGHMDSAYEFNIWLFFKNAAIPIMIVTVLAFVYLLVVSVMRSVALYNLTADADLYLWLGVAAVALYPLVGLFAFFHTYTPVPGAMDDMAGVAVAAGLGRCLHDAKKNGEFYPENTEVVLIGMACEEAGLRGARRYVQRHLQELKRTPTFGLFLDGVYDEQFLTVIHREICTGAKHDPALVKMAQDVAANRNWPIIRTVIPLGASDATEFSNAGIPSVCLLCQDTSKLVPNYHTRYDTIEKIKPRSLAVAMQMTLDMLERIDGGAKKAEKKSGHSGRSGRDKDEKEKKD